jgi:hypothetical protein
VETVRDTLEKVDTLLFRIEELSDRPSNEVFSLASCLTWEGIPRCGLGVVTLSSGTCETRTQLNQLIGEGKQVRVPTKLHFEVRTPNVVGRQARLFSS